MSVEELNRIENFGVYVNNFLCDTMIRFRRRIVLLSLVGLVPAVILSYLKVTGQF